MKTKNPPRLVCPQVSANNFADLVFSRSAVRLESGNYCSPTDYRADRRAIEKDTKELTAAWRTFLFRLEHWPSIAADCLAEAAKGSRFESDSMGRWSYCPGQYYPLEIRGAAADLIRRADTLAFSRIHGKGEGK